MPKSLKPLLLLGMALFLYNRLVNGIIFFYINRRFVWLTWLAVGALLLVTLSYHRTHKLPSNHAHRLTWRAAALISLPVLVGWLIPPQPLGTAALSSREVNAVPQAALTLSAPAIRQATEQQRALTLLDWVLAFGEHPDPAAFAGQSADLIGFVYRREGLPPDTWLLSRFVVTCCVADATAIGILVRAPDVEVANDTWVQVQGHFAAENVGDEQLPVLAAATVIPIEPPTQPYLYYR
ncbi:MAG: TIGR03943 family protein [Anaerolineae bacterium]|nr:TIGR03943 family protein [Anaerolineae bacterium]